MRRHFRFLAAAGLACGMLLTGTLSAFAQDEVRSTRVRKVSYVMRSRVLIEGGSSIGRVEDFVINEDGCIDFLVVSYNERLILVPWSVAKVTFRSKVVRLDITRDRLREIPTFTKTRWPDLSNTRYTRRIYNVFKVDGSRPRRDGVRDRGERDRRTDADRRDQGERDRRTDADRRDRDRRTDADRRDRDRRTDADRRTTDRDRRTDADRRDRDRRTDADRRTTDKDRKTDTAPRDKDRDRDRDKDRKDSSPREDDERDRSDRPKRTDSVDKTERPVKRGYQEDNRRPNERQNKKEQPVKRGYQEDEND